MQMASATAEAIKHTNRGERIRTSDLVDPNHTRYQTALRPGRSILARSTPPDKKNQPPIRQPHPLPPRRNHRFSPRIAAEHTSVRAWAGYYRSPPALLFLVASPPSKSYPLPARPNPAPALRQANPPTFPVRIEITKTYKLFIGGAFPRSESGRSLPVLDAGGNIFAHACKASRKDLREAVVAARKAQPGWASAAAYNRGQILYRIAEMLEARRAEFVALLMLDPAVNAPQAEAEFTATVERLVHFAGWTDKFTHILGSTNAVAGPYWNITTPTPQGCIAIVAPAAPALLPLVALLAPIICSGNAAIVLTPANAAVVSVLGEVLATSDLPGGVVNLLTGSVDELAPVAAKHRDLDGIAAAGLPGGLTGELAKTLQLGAAENLKRIKLFELADLLTESTSCSPWMIEPFIESKTVWHPTGV